MNSGIPFLSTIHKVNRLFFSKLDEKDAWLGTFYNIFAE